MTTKAKTIGYWATTGFLVGRSGFGRSAAAAGVPQSPAATRAAAYNRIFVAPTPAIGR